MGSENPDLSCFVSDCTSMAGAGREPRKEKKKKLTANAHPQTHCSEWNILPIPTNCIIQFPSTAVRDNKASKCECKCSGTWCIIALLIACLLQKRCRALVQYLRACPGGVMHTSSSPGLPRSPVLRLPFPRPCVYVLRQRAAVSSPSFGWEMESSSAKSHRRGPHRHWKEVVRREGGGVLCYHDDLVKLVKGRPVNPKLLGFFLLVCDFFPSMTVLIKGAGGWGGGATL